MEPQWHLIPQCLFIQQKLPQLGNVRGWRVAVLSTNKTAEKKCERIKNTSVWRCWLQLHLHVKHDVKRGSAWSLSIPSAHQQPVLPSPEALSLLHLCSHLSTKCHRPNFSLSLPFYSKEKGLCPCYVPVWLSMAQNDEMQTFSQS